MRLKIKALDKELKKIKEEGKNWDRVLQKIQIN
jgi:hypothetical protein